MASASAANLALQGEVSALAGQLAEAQAALEAARREVAEQQALAAERQKRFVVVQARDRQLPALPLSPASASIASCSKALCAILLYGEEGWHACSMAPDLCFPLDAILPRA